MQKVFICLVPVVLFLMASISPTFGFGGGSITATAETAETLVAEKMKALTIPVRKKGTEEVLQVPLFSESNAQLPVATVDGEPITLREFALELATMHSDMTDSEVPQSQSLTRMLDRLIAIKLVKLEALSIGFERMPAIQKQIENFALKTLIQQLLARQIENLQPDAELVDELYRQMALEVKTLTYRFQEKVDAELLLEGLQSGEDFKTLAAKMLADGKAEGGEDGEYLRLNELFPSVAKAVFDMEIGTVSEIFQAEKGFLVFRLEDRRIYEDQPTRLAAQNMALQQKSQTIQMDYLRELSDRYASFDDEVMATVDFEQILAKEPDASRTAVLVRLQNDQRPVVTISNGNATATITVAEVAGALKSAMYHGVDSTINANKMNSQKVSFIKDKLTAITGKMEAEQQKIHLTAAYLETVAKFTEQVLFDTFMAKAVLPGLVVPEKDVRTYYYNNLEEYSSPLMLKMKSLVFTDPQNAEDATQKLRDGSDFKWVSANATGLADPENKDILGLGGSLLSETALPHDLAHQVAGAQQGDIFLYAGLDNLYYTLVVESAFPPKAKTYEEVRQEVGKIIYGQMVNKALEDWVGKLKQAYETEVFIVQNDP